MNEVDVVCYSHARLTPVGVDIEVELPRLKGPVKMGVRDEIAAHYGFGSEIEQRAATLDYITGAIGACLTATFAEMLEARSVSASGLRAEATGMIVKDGGVLRLSQIEVSYRLPFEDSERELVERVHDMHARACPAHRSVEASIKVRTTIGQQTKQPKSPPPAVGVEL